MSKGWFTMYTCGVYGGDVCGGDGGVCDVCDGVG